MKSLLPKSWLSYLNDRLEEVRLHLARPDALLLLSVMGLLTGLLAGLIIVVFRLLVEGSQEMLLPGEGPENYEALSIEWRFIYPILGAVALAILFRYGSKGLHVLGVASVMERMAYHQGHLSERGFMLQFFGAAIAIISGHSVGREGPHIFLGAAAGSLLGQHLSLPNNTIRALVGCGTAAGIAASFNTPLAGVIFALEVVMMEYTVASFIPVILAAVSATTVSTAILGDTSVFGDHTLEMGGLSELWLVALLGILAGTFSAWFIQLIELIASSSRSYAIWWRVIAAGLGIALIGILVPEVMGIGYDSVSQALGGGIAIGVLVVLLVGKLVATSISIGLGVPGGMIGPALFIGAMLGALVGEIAQLSPFDLGSHIGFYALLGMGAMMSGSLQAPLAALTAMLELTDNPDIILPGMLVVVMSGITASVVFKKETKDDDNQAGKEAS